MRLLKEILRGLRKRCIRGWAPEAQVVPGPSSTARVPEAHGENLPSLGPTGSRQRREGT